MYYIEIALDMMAHESIIIQVKPGRYGKTMVLLLNYGRIRTIN